MIPAATAPAAAGVELRQAVAQGVRWTLWLAALALPVSFGTRILLARLGPGPLADYGLLTVYLNFTAAFLFLGGNAVAIRFLPAMAAGERRNFLFTYALIIAAAWLPWLGVAWWRPDWLGWLFGPLGPSFRRVMVGLAPVVILNSLLLAALKALLDIAWSQWLYRGITGAMFAGSLAAFLVAPGWLARNAAGWLWGGYMLLAAAVTGLAWRRLRRSCPAGHWRWRLPHGFAAYTGNLQGSSALGFFATQLDVILVLHYGTTQQLGMYVALTGLVLLGIAALKLLLDSMMAALAHSDAMPESQTAERIWRSYIRLILPLLAGFGAALACAAGPLLRLYGPAYRHLVPALVGLAPGAALFGLNCVLGSTLAALGYPQDEVRAKLVRIAVFAAVFWPLWRAWGLLGAALAWTVAEAPYQGLNLWFLRRRARFALGLARVYPAFLCALALGEGMAVWAGPRGVGWSLLLWSGVMLAFLAAAGFGTAEVWAQIRMVLPGPARQEWI